MALLRTLYDRTMALAAHRHAVWALAGLSFAEASVFIVPPDVLLIPMVLAARARAYFYAGVCTAASVLGGLLGYAIGYFVFEAVGRPLLEFYGQAQSFQDFAALYNEWGAWIVAFAGASPFPYKVITIASGATGLDLLVFAVASTASRGLRFFLEAALLWYFGPPIRDFIERNLKWAVTLFLVLLFGGFLLVRYVI